MICFPLDNVEYEAKALGAWLGTRTRGVFSAEGNLAVKPGGELAVLVEPGLAWLKADAYWGTVCFLEESQRLTLEAAHPALPRMDAICLRLDKAAGSADLAVKRGENALTPMMPLPERSLDADEIVLAAVRVPAGAVQVDAGSISDCRLDEKLCGLMRDGVSVIPTEVLQAQAAALMELVESELARLNAGSEMMLKAEYAADAQAELREGVLHISSVYGHPGSQYDVRFTVPEGYEPGMAVEIDGQAVELRDADNEPAELEAAPGVPAWLTRRGDKAFFKPGGGLKLHIKGGATRPERPREGSLWVETAQAMTKTTLTATQPSVAGLPEGTVWIRTGSESGAAFNAGGKNPVMLYPKTAAQLQGGSWRGRPLQVYADGQWLRCGRVVAPNLIEWPLAGWASNYGRSAAADGRISGGLAPSNYGIGYVYTAVDVTDWQSLRMNCNYSNNSRLDYNFYLGMGYSTGTMAFTDGVNNSTGLPVQQVLGLGKSVVSGQMNASFDVSGLRGVIYVGLRYYGNAYGAARSLSYTFNSIEVE